MSTSAHFARSGGAGGSGGVAGSSPTARLSHAHAHTAARKFAKRLLYDDSLDPGEFSVGLIETREQAERKSGAEAWSLRVHSSLLELPFTELLARYGDDAEAVPYHRIAWFKRGGVVVWEARCTADTQQQQQGAPPALHGGGSGSFGCSPPSLGGITARFSNSDALVGVPGGLPPRGCAVFAAATAAAAAAASPGDVAAAAAAAAAAGAGALGCGSTAVTGAHHTPIYWQQRVSQRHSSTDYSSSPGGWGGPGHWSAGAAAAGSLSGVSGGAGCAHMPLPGSSPIGASPRGPGSWGGLIGPPRHSGGGGGGGVSGVSLAAATRGSVSASPGAGSCSSSWTGTGSVINTQLMSGRGVGLPTAADVCSGTVHSAASAQAAATADHYAPAAAAGGTDKTDGDPAAALADASGNGCAAVDTVDTADAPGGGGGDGGVNDEALLPQADAPAADYSELPLECWLNVMARLPVRELCVAARVSRSLRELAGRPFLWSCAYDRLFGAPPPTDWSAQTVKRLCRRSELRASRWTEAEVAGVACGFAGTLVLQLDDSKVLSGDGSAVRLWAHDTGRRIATLRGHSGRVTAVSFDDEHILSGDAGGGLRLWSMDELRQERTLRHHTDAVTAVALLHGMPVSAGADGLLCVWDAAAPNTPLVALEAGGPLAALQLQPDAGHVISAGAEVVVWDLHTSQRLTSLQAPPPPGVAAAALSRSSSGASVTRGSGSSGGGGGGNASPAAAAAAAVSAAAPVGPATDGVAAGDADGGELDPFDGDDVAGGVLLHEAYWAQEEEEEEEQAPAHGGGHLSGGGGGAATSVNGSQTGSAAGPPFTSVSVNGSLVAAGRAGSVVLWDLRCQQAVGTINQPRVGGGSTPLDAPCVGVQLDEWKLVTGWVGGGGGGGGGGAAWWRGDEEAPRYSGGGSGDAAAAAAPHCLYVYDVRSAAGQGVGGGTTATTPTASAAGGLPHGGGGAWSAGAPLLSLALPARVTCFQFHGQRLLVGQEGSECCLLSFQPPGAARAAAWAAAGAGASGYGCSPIGTGGGTGGGVPGWVEESGEGGGGSGRGGKTRRKGTLPKVPPKKSTRYPKRATR